MQTFNLHTHTVRCGHASGEDEAYVQAAIEAGFSVLGFSDHVPWTTSRVFTDRMPMDLKDDYLNSIERLKQKYKHEITILSGYECEYFPELADELKLRKAEVDYLILGLHNPEMDVRDFARYNEDDDLLDYARLMEEACASGLFTYIAHPEYFMKGRQVWNDRCIEVTHRICKAAEKAKIPMEVNLNGMRYGLQNYGELGDRYPYPFYEFWQIVAQYDIQTVFGFDAHKPVTLTEDFRYNKVMEILNDLSFSWIEDPFSIIK